MKNWLERYEQEQQDQVDWLRLHRFEDSEKAEKYCRELMICAEERNDPTMLGVAHAYLGETFYAQGLLKAAVDELENAYPYLINGESQVMTSICCMQLGSIQLESYSYEAAVGRFLQGMDITEKHGLKDLHPLFCQRIGDVYTELKEYNRALEYFLKAEKEVREEPDAVGYIQSHNEVVISGSILECYLWTDQMEKAEEYLKKLDEQMKNHPNPELDEFLYHRIRFCFAEKLGQEEEILSEIKELEKILANELLYGGEQGDLVKILNRLYENGRQDLVAHMGDIIEKLLASELPDIRRVSLLSLCWKMTEDKHSEKAVRLMEELIAAQEKRDEFERRTKLSAIESLVERNRHMGEVEQWMDEANHDPLTGMWNRRYMDIDFEEMKQLSIKDASVEIGVGTIDVDFFKQYNDNYGHVAGDECLHRLAELFIQNADKDLHFLRFGGDEFVLLSKGLTAEQLRERLQMMADDLNTMNLTTEHSPISDRITLSIGAVVTHALKEETTLKDLLYQSDQLLYQVKAAGKDGICIDNYEL